MITSEALRPSTNQSRKAHGKMWSRLEDLKNPWRSGYTMEFSHNESVRLATDALLQSGEQGYQRILKEEKELPFLSSTEIKYITENATGNCSLSSAELRNKRYSLNGSIDGDTFSEQTSGTYFPLMSDMEPAALELGWPETYTARYSPTEAQVYFQTDKSHNLKDMIRSFISTAKTLIAVVMDLFTDVDLLLDLMEASIKRKVPVYILLDEKNLQYFIDMCNNLDIKYSNFSNVKIRSVCGDTYCTKSGQKFTGQVLEKFLIVDCEQVITGSYSFTWLSGQVHSNMVVHFKGKIIEQFDRQFRCLYADSKIIDCFHNPEDEMADFSSRNVLKALQIHVLPEPVFEVVLSNPSSSLSSSSQNSIKQTPFNTSAIKVHHEQRGPNAHFISPERKSTSPPYRHDRGLNDNINMLFHGEKSALNSTRPTGQILQPKPFGRGLFDARPNLAQLNISAGNDMLNRALQTEQESHLKQTQRGGFFKKFPAESPSSREQDRLGFTKQSPQPVDKYPKEIMEDSESNATLSFHSGATDASSEVRKSGIKRDDKRMTLGHSRLDLVQKYNIKHPKKVYSRFETNNDR